MTEADLAYETADQNASAQREALEGIVARVEAAAVRFAELWVSEQVAGGFAAFYARTQDGSTDRIRTLKAARDTFLATLPQAITDALAGDRYWRHRSDRFLAEAVADEKTLLKFDLMREVEDVLRGIVSGVGALMEQGEILDLYNDRAWSREHQGHLLYRGGLGAIPLLVEPYHHFVNAIPDYMDALSTYRVLLVERQEARYQQLEAQARALWDSV